MSESLLKLRSRWRSELKHLAAEVNELRSKIETFMRRRAEVGVRGIGFDSEADFELQIRTFRAQMDASQSLWNWLDQKVTQADAYLQDELTSGPLSRERGREGVDPIVWKGASKGLAAEIERLWNQEMIEGDTLGEAIQRVSSMFRDKKGKPFKPKSLQTALRRMKDIQ